MAQVFHPAFNTIARASIFGFAFIIAGLAWLAYGVQKSPYLTHQGITRDQPVPFSHEHHVRGLGIDLGCPFVVPITWLEGRGTAASPITCQIAPLAPVFRMNNGPS